MTASIHTTCPYCGVGCGVKVDSQGAVAGDPLHPANRGALCVKGMALGESQTLPHRLLYPRVDGRQVDWSEAIDTVAGGFRDIIEQHGPQAVAFYGSGQMMTEDYYVANKLMKGFIGSANMDTNSRLCMSSAVAAQQRAFGEDAVPASYEDLAEAELVILVGANSAWTHPILFRRLEQARAANPKQQWVVIDPRGTATSQQTNLHLQITPGSDLLLFNGLARRILDRAGMDCAFVERHVAGFAELSLALSGPEYTTGKVAEATGLSVAELNRFYQLFLDNPKTLTLFCMGINQSERGSDNVNAIINCHLLTGRIGKPGAAPFSLTGQPNAMGGREVGGLANQLAAHMDFAPDNRDKVARFWHTDNLAPGPGLKAMEMIDALERGDIKALWVMGSNPAVSLPDSVRVRRALEKCELLVVSDISPNTDTARLARVLLPAAGWGEKDGTVTNSVRTLSRQRPFKPAPGAARADWWAICQVARAMGFEQAFAFDSPAAIFREHAALSGFENNGQRLFDISALSHLNDEQYQGMTPRSWPLAGQQSGPARLFADGRFSTPDGKARLHVGHARSRPEPAGARLLLNTGRLRDQWHTMSRTGHVARLMATASEPQAQIHPQTLARAGLDQAQLVQLHNERGHTLLRVVADDNIAPGEIFVPMHWSGEFGSGGRVNDLVTARGCPTSGQPAFKQNLVQVAAVQHQWQASWIGLTAPSWLPEWWSLRPLESGECWSLIDSQTSIAEARAALTREGSWLDWPLPRGRLLIGLNAGKIESLLLLGHLPWQINPDPLASLLGSPLQPSLLIAQLSQALAGNGRLVCSCWSVTEESIRQAIDDGVEQIDELQQQLKCGTRCGSCIPELKQLMAACQDQPQGEKL
ncbi:assimilatory nitrate reductase catalytic subunit [Oceanisphaera litoralis]|uniref:nitrate reductase n=1 Tax=Oceanisphaera litoralis TaxID=225144 RepID=UPI001EF77DF2|nr:nitrate reductase [Oceanisphaera litoralis]MBM7455358.1 assimilatory nitrate reductase catalytic subunit [Oceanisphaera litoralis]